jgi:hypothetical protein
MKPFLWLDFDGVLRHWPAALFNLNPIELSHVLATAFINDLVELDTTGQVWDTD